ncbi:MAG TPA: twin-arginine translocase TatA/TatE family subunit [Planctomycetota bacterium]|jgi:sec-independent protein translocase protein TatA|nr:twin-arginine translocase TatA/TatE family subunit [Planctomycetota bacterium]OQC21056.1 MAG: twin arginine translocase protein A [Planctomycetes bacterium ADurb.Bin069]NMD36354.1 twin-arginine translocase TatA/TatE family subunit [Planctomycetota bacterium]HNR99446.1 twin-arginine translocase TatA/TatE family subunit [Planctomycetota bacterium]HNU25986.1 twin-arginine translocase TatA/TatE family subunit [Planctomycetota bacterium]
MDLFPTLALIPNLGPLELVVIGIVALLLFGRRLPEVMRNLGRGIVEFKRGVRGIEDQVDQAASLPPQQPRYEQPVQPAPSQAAPAQAAPPHAAVAPAPSKDQGA